MVTPQPLEQKPFEPLPPELPTSSEMPTREFGRVAIENFARDADAIAREKEARVAQEAAWVDSYAASHDEIIPPEDAVIFDVLKKKPKNLLQRFFDYIGALNDIKKNVKAEREDVARSAEWENEVKDMTPLAEAVGPLELSRPEKSKSKKEKGRTGEAAKRDGIINDAIARGDRAVLAYWLSILNDDWEAGVKKISEQKPTVAEKKLYKEAIAGNADLRGEPTELDYVLMDIKRVNRALAEAGNPRTETTDVSQTPTREVPSVGKKTSPEIPRVRPRIEKMTEADEDDDTPTEEVPRVTTPRIAAARSFETDEVVSAKPTPKTAVDLAPPTIETPRVIMSPKTKVDNAPPKIETLRATPPPKTKVDLAPPTIETPRVSTTEVDLAPPTIETPVAPEFNEQAYRKDRATFIKLYTDFEDHNEQVKENPELKTVVDIDENFLDKLNFFGRYGTHIDKKENEAIANEVLALLEARRKKRVTIETPPAPFAKTLAASVAKQKPTPTQELGKVLEPIAGEIDATPEEYREELAEREAAFLDALERGAAETPSAARKTPEKKIGLNELIAWYGALQAEINVTRKYLDEMTNATHREGSEKRIIELEGQRTRILDDYGLRVYIDDPETARRIKHEIDEATTIKEYGMQRLLDNSDTKETAPVKPLKKTLQGTKKVTAVTRKMDRPIVETGPETLRAFETELDAFVKTQKELDDLAKKYPVLAQKKARGEALFRAKFADILENPYAQGLLEEKLLDTRKTTEARAAGIPTPPATIEAEVITSYEKARAAYVTLKGELEFIGTEIALQRLPKKDLGVLAARKLQVVAEQDNLWVTFPQEFRDKILDDENMNADVQRIALRLSQEKRSRKRGSAAA